MPKVASSGSSKPKRQLRPALTPEARENQLIALAMDLVEQRLIDGTASSQETTHFLKLGSTKERMEKEILKEQKKLITAKTEALESSKNNSKLYEDAIAAMRVYSGHGQEECVEYDD